MAGFSASEAGLAGLRLVRERPRAFLTWAAVQLLIGLVFGGLMITLAGPMLAEIAARQASLQAGVQPDPAEAMRALGQMMRFNLVVLPLALVFYAVWYAAMNRAILRPSDDRFGYLRLGRDELRQVGLMLYAMLVGLGGYIALVVVVAVLAIGAVFAGSALHGAGPSPQMGGVLLALGIFAVVLLGVIWMAVRLSLASAMTFDRCKISLFASWTLTKGRFWSMFGAYLLAFVLSFVLFLAILIVSFAATAAFGGGMSGLKAMFHPDTTSLNAYFIPARLITLVVGCCAGALQLALMLTPAPYIYRAITADPAAAFGRRDMDVMSPP